jgi:MoxR-like ATPase
MMQGRDHALPDDVQALAEPVLAHRLVLAPETARGAGKDVITDAISSVRAL